MNEQCNHENTEAELYLVKGVCHEREWCLDCGELIADELFNPEKVES